MTTISIQCTHCHKGFKAPASMAGKKVKCKHCGKIFEIPASAAAGEEIENDSPQTGVPAPFKAVQKSAAAAKAKSPENTSDDVPKSTPAGGKLGQASAGYAARLARNESAVEVELAGESAPILMLRPSIPHDFPGAAVLDQWGPLLMILIGLGWLSYMAIQSNTSDQGWVGTTRLGAYLFLSLFVAFPLGFLAIRIAAGKCRLMLPPMAAIRALGIFTLAFALALVFWLSAGSVGMLVTGTIMGLALVCVAVWFFFRVQSQEMSTVLGSAGAAFIGSVVLSYFILFGVNAIFASSARSSGKNQLAVSPMGPTFDWDIPIDSPGKKNTRTVAVVNPDTQPQTNPSTTPVTDPQPNTTTTPTTHTVVAATDPVQPPIPTTVPTPTTTATVTPPTTTPVTVTPATVPVVVVPPAISPLVAKLTTVTDLGDFNQVVFPSGNGNGNVVAAIKKGETEETVAFLSGNPLAMKGETKFDVEKDLPQKYCLSANGETLARLSSFPKLSVTLWNTSANKEIKVVPLNAERGKPELLGFGVNDNIVVLWNTGSFIDVEVINARANPTSTVVLLRLKTFERSPCNPTISPDGRQMAVATFIDKKGGIDLWDLTTARKAELRTCFVPLGTWVTPTSITYSGTGGQLSAYFELGTKGVIYSFRIGDGGLLHEHAYRTLPYPAGAVEAFTGRSLDYVDANDYVLLGRPIIDSESGKVLGDLQVENVKAQRVIDKETLLLHTQTAEGKNQLVEVKLKPDVIAAKRAEARGVKPKGP